MWADTLSSEVPGKPGTSVKEREGNKCEEKFSLVYRSIRMVKLKLDRKCEKTKRYDTER